MSGGGKTTTTRLDPDSQSYVNAMRRGGATGAAALERAPGTLYSPESMSIYDQASQFMNPWMQQVLDPVNAQFDRALDQNRIGTGDAARGAGAFGSARHGVAQAVGMGEIERGRASVLGNLLNSQWQTAVGQGLQYQQRQRELERMQMMDPFLRAQMATGLRGAALGPTGQTTTEKQQGNTWGQIAGLGLGIAGTMMGGPAGGAIASNVGSGLFGNALGQGGGVNPMAYTNRWQMPSSGGPASVFATPPGGFFNY